MPVYERNETTREERGERESLWTTYDPVGQRCLESTSADIGCMAELCLDCTCKGLDRLCAQGGLRTWSTGGSDHCEDHQVHDLAGHQALLCHRHRTA